LLERVAIDVAAWVAALDRFQEPFLPERREQPETPVRHLFG
jgi:hypothetical protein